MPKVVKAGLEPKLWQISIGLPLARLLDRVVFNSGLAHKVEVVSFLDGEVYLIKIFKLNSSGEILYKGSSRKGVEFLRIKIKFPNQFCLLLTDSNGKKYLFEFLSAKGLEEKSKIILEELLCIFWLSSF